MPEAADHSDQTTEGTDPEPEATQTGAEGDQTEPAEPAEGDEPEVSSGDEGTQSIEERLESKLDAMNDRLEAERAKREKLETRLEEERERRQKDLDEDLSEAEKLERELEDQREKLRQEREKRREARIEGKIERKAVEAGLRNPERTLRLIDRDGIELDDSGEVVGVDAAIEELRDEMPDLFGDPGVETSSASSGASKPSDREQASEGGEPSEYEKGRQMARRVDERKNDSRL